MEAIARAVTSRRTGELALAVSLACSAALLVSPVHEAAGRRIVLSAGAALGWLLALAVTLRGRPPRRAVLFGGVALVLGLALLRPPQASQDLWTYVMHGRVQARHDASPYVVTSSDVEEVDPFVERVSPGWRSTPSPYGPLFSAIEATGAAVAGDSPTANRLVHQGLAAAAVGAALLLAGARRRRSAVVLLGGCPATVMIVNGGHNDLLVGLGILTTVWALERRRVVVATGALAAAALVKLTALVTLPAFAWWLWHRGQRRAALVLVAATSGVVALGYVVAGGMTALRPVIDTGGQTTRASLWWVLYRGVDPAMDIESFATAGPLLALAVLAVVVLARYRNRPTPGPAALGLLVAQLATLPWLMPWYVGWALPAAARGADEEPALLAAVLAAVLVVGYAVPPGVSGPEVVDTVSSAVLPAFVLIAAVVVLTRRSRLRPA